MPAFFLTMMACLLVTAAGREQVFVARLSAVLGRGAGLFVAIAAAAAATCAVAAWAGSLLAPVLNDVASQMLVALALLLAGMELLMLRPYPAPREPTRSTGAILLVLLARQLTDGARFLVLALAVQTGEPPLAAVGGAVGSIVALVIAAMAGGQWEALPPRQQLTRIVAALLVLAAIIIGLSARGLIG